MYAPDGLQHGFVRSESVTTHVCLHSLGLISIEKDLGLFVGFNLSEVWAWVLKEKMA